MFKRDKIRQRFSCIIAQQICLYLWETGSLKLDIFNIYYKKRKSLESFVHVCVCVYNSAIGRKPRARESNPGFCSLS